MSPSNSRNLHTREILERLEAGEPLSQRSLSCDLGIALGLTNLLLRQMARKGWVRLLRVKPNRVRYLITPAGLAEKARLSVEYLRYSIKFYADARDRIRGSFSTLVREAEAESRPVRVVFWSASEIAEIAYVCLQDSDVRLVGVVDDARVGSRFFEHSVLSSGSVDGGRLAGKPFDRVVVFPVEDPVAAQRRLIDSGVSLQSVFLV